MIEPRPLASLAHVVRALEGRDRQFALVGGLAVAVRGEVRFTRDVDIAVAVTDDDDAERLVFDLQQDGYSVAATVEHAQQGRFATVRLQGPDGIICDLLFASSGIERLIVALATRMEVTPDVTIPVARAEELLALKVLSVNDERLQDAMDIQSLLDFNPELDMTVVRGHLELIQQLGFDRDQDLIAKLERFLTSQTS